MLRYAIPPSYLPPAYPPVPALPAAVAAPPAEVLPPTPLGARAEDTGKCKMFYPERCASNAFVKKCSLVYGGRPSTWPCENYRGE